MKKLFLTVATLFGVFGVMWIADANASSALAPEISLKALKAAVDTKSITLVDANGLKTYKEAHIPGAISFAKYENKIDDFLKVLPTDKNAAIVAYCGGPLCSAWEDAAKVLKEKGYTNVQHFKGGIKVWKEKGYSVAKGA